MRTKRNVARTRKCTGETMNDIGKEMQLVYLSQRCCVDINLPDDPANKQKKEYVNNNDNNK